MGFLEVKNLCFDVKDFKLDKISFSVNQGEYFILLGKSGSGKTLLLESIAGFNKIEGSIDFEGHEISSLAPERRDVGFVYQDFALFPNMSVKENIMFSARYKKVENPEETLSELVDFLGLENLLERRVEGLSGGERQRVAIARALFSKPKILLLDEPLSAIDPTFRNSIMKFLKDIHRKFNLTTIHVTHNFREASYLGDKIAIVMGGKIHQRGTASEVLNNPASLEVAEFLGFKNIFPCSLLKEKEQNRLFSVDPNSIYVSNDTLQNDFVFSGKIEECMGMVDHFKLFIDVEGHQFFAKILKRDYQEYYRNRGQNVFIGFDRKDTCYL
jgi:molybdate/tungstate transport system ATP-binding protein